MNRLNFLFSRIFFFIGILLFCTCVNAEGEKIRIVNNHSDDLRGIFALAKSGKPIDERLLVHPDVAGIVVRQKWSELEPSESQYDWQYLDKQFTRIYQSNKQISFILGYGGLSIPKWLLRKDIRLFTFMNDNTFSQTFGETMKIPLFWDSKVLAYKKKIIRMLGTRYANQPGLTMVSAQCANALTGDWNIPRKARDIIQWKKMGYSSEKLIRACQEVVDTTMQAFPNQVVKMAIGPVPSKLGDKSAFVAKSVIRYAHEHYPGRFIAQRNNLSTTTPDPRIHHKLHVWKLIWDNRPAVAAQMLWNATNTDTCRLNGKRKPCDSERMLKEAIDIGLAYQMNHLEIYAIDLLKPYGKKVLHETAQILNK